MACKSCHPETKLLVFETTICGKRVVISKPNIQDKIPNELTFVGFIPGEHKFPNKGNSLHIINDALREFAEKEYPGRPYKLFSNSSSAASWPDHLHAFIVVCPEGQKAISFFKMPPVFE